MNIEKKTWPEFFQKIVEGKKTFEVRLADFSVNPGDILVLKEWNPETRQYTGRVLEKKVTYVSKTKSMAFWSQEDLEKYGLQIIAFNKDEVKDDQKNKK